LFIFHKEKTIKGDFIEKYREVLETQANPRLSVSAKRLHHKKRLYFVKLCFT
jgi:hypothetical protein